MSQNSIITTTINAADDLNLAKRTGFKEKWANFGIFWREVNMKYGRDLWPYRLRWIGLDVVRHWHSEVVCSTVVMRCEKDFRDLSFA